MTQERLRELLDYDGVSGDFRWRRKVGSFGAGRIAGALHDHGYIRIGVDGRRYYAHRLAWMYVHGRWPEPHIDHIDGNPANNAIANLREATMSQNLGNRTRQQVTNTSGYRGVSQRNKRFRAYTKYQGNDMHLGYFDTAEEAAEKVRSVRSELFGEFAGTAV